MSTLTIQKKTSNQLLIAKILNILVLIGSIVILGVLSAEILNESLIITHKLYLNIQLIICLIFLADFCFLFYISKNKWKYFFTNFILLLVSIPYYNIIDWLDISVTPIQGIMLRAIVFIRGGYGLVVMINWFTKSKVTNMMITYLVMLVAMAYFGSLVFYSIEMGKNPGLHHFEDAVWWACMDVTTVGCAIEPVTGAGRILAVILAVMGMSMFPILTVYITNYFQNNVTSQSSNSSTTSSATATSSTQSSTSEKS